MIHDPDLIDTLSSISAKPFAGFAYRATRVSLHPLTFTCCDGRWMPSGLYSILYTSLNRETALAEITHYWSQLNPLPSKPVLLSKLEINTFKIIKLTNDDFLKIFNDDETLKDENVLRCQEIGAASVFLGFDGLIAPSARFDGDNLMLFQDNLCPDAVQVIESEEIDWQAWARDNNLLL